MKYILLFTLTTLFFSCSKDKTLEPQCLEEISYLNDVEPIIMNSCAVSGCHNAESQANDIILENYDQIFALRDLILKAVRHEAGVVAMPIGEDQLSGADIRKITCWIEQGAENN